MTGRLQPYIQAAEALCMVDPEEKHPLNPLAEEPEPLKMWYALSAMHFPVDHLPEDEQREYYSKRADAITAYVRKPTPTHKVSSDKKIKRDKDDWKTVEFIQKASDLAINLWNSSSIDYRTHNSCEGIPAQLNEVHPI